MSQYGIPYTGLWFQTAMEVLFWTYTSFAFVTSSGMYLILWSTQLVYEAQRRNNADFLLEHFQSVI